jgi:hypothetical protein
VVLRGGHVWPHVRAVATWSCLFEKLEQSQAGCCPQPQRRCPLGPIPHQQHLLPRFNRMRETSIEAPELKANRRRSLGALFRIPLSARSPDYHSISTSKPVGSIPADIIREIVDLLAPADILSFSLTVHLSFHLQSPL